MVTQEQKTTKNVGLQQQRGQKIAYVLTCFPTLTETFIKQELQELERQGVELHIFSLTKPSNVEGAKAIWNGRARVTYISQYSKLRLLVYTIKYFLKTPLRFISLFIMGITGRYPLKTLMGCIFCATFIAETLEREQVTHLHAHFAAESTTVAQFTHVLTDVPYSFTAHAYDIYLAPAKALASKINMARFVVAVTAYNQRYLANLVPERVSKRIHCIYNGLNLDMFPAHSSGAQLRKPPLILAVSRLVEKKGLFYLVQACSILAKQGYEFTCSIVGDGPLRQELEQKIGEMQLSDRIVLQGAQTHEQVLELYQKATMMALPCIISKNGDRDGLPTVLIEAMCTGTPVVSTSVSGIPELLTSEVNGLIVPPEGSIALAHALARLLDDRVLCQRLALAGHQTVLERFDIVSNIKSLVELFYPKEGENYRSEGIGTFRVENV